MGYSDEKQTIKSGVVGFDRRQRDGESWFEPFYTSGRIGFNNGMLGGRGGECLGFVLFVRERQDQARPGKTKTKMYILHPLLPLGLDTDTLSRFSLT